MGKSKKEINDLKANCSSGIRYEKYRIKWFNSRNMYKEAMEAQQCLEFWKQIKESV